MTVTKHYEHDHVMLYVEEDGKRNCITLESDAQIRRLADCLIDLDREKSTDRLLVFVKMEEIKDSDV